MGSSFEIGAGESIRHSTLSHFFQIVGQVLIARILVSDFLCQGAQLVVLDRHLFSEGILVLKMHLDLHCVATIEPLHQLAKLCVACNTSGWPATPPLHTPNTSTYINHIIMYHVELKG